MTFTYSCRFVRHTPPSAQDFPANRNVLSYLDYSPTVLQRFMRLQLDLTFSAACGLTLLGSSCKSLQVVLEPDSQYALRNL